MRRRRAEALEPFGLSFLDLIACAFGGLLIFYLTAPEPRREEAGERSRLSVVEVQAAEAVPATLGLRVRSRGGTWASWQSGGEDGDATWLVTPGKTTLLLEQPLGAAVVEVVALSLPPEAQGRPLAVLVHRDGGPGPRLVLLPEALYRRRATLPPAAPGPGGDAREDNG